MNFDNAFSELDIMEDRRNNIYEETQKYLNKATGLNWYAEYFSRAHFKFIYDITEELNCSCNIRYFNGETIISFIVRLNRVRDAQFNSIEEFNKGLKKYLKLNNFR